MRLIAVCALNSFCARMVGVALMLLSCQLLLNILENGETTCILAISPFVCWAALIFREQATLIRVDGFCLSRILRMIVSLICFLYFNDSSFGYSIQSIYFPMTSLYFFPFYHPIARYTNKHCDHGVPNV